MNFNRIANTVSLRPGMFPGIVFRPDGGDDNTPPAGGDDKDKIEFTPAQQAFLEKKINEAYGKGASKAEERMNGKLTELQSQLEKLNSGRGEGGDPNKGDKTYTQADVQAAIEAALKEPGDKLSAAEKRVQALLTRDRTAAIVSAAAKAKAVDPEEVAILVGRFVTHDENERIVVVNDNGQPRLNNKGEAMTVEEFVKQYVDSKPHLKGGSGVAGTGSSSINQSQKAGKPKTMQEANAALAQFFGGGKA